jgi:oligoendopeptidase F
MNKTRLCSTWIFVTLAGVSAFPQGQPASPALSADLTRYYFASPATELTARADLDKAVAQLVALKGKINSAAKLLEALRTNDTVEDLFAKHEGYLHFVCSQDRKSPACEADQKIESDVDSQIAFLAPEVVAIPADRLREFVAAEPALSRYRFALADMRRDAPFTLPGPEQSLLDEFQPHIADWQYDLYQQIVAGIPFGKVKTKSGELDIVRQRSLIAADPDPKVREDGFKLRYAGFASQRELLAFALIHTVQAQSALARSHGYADAPARKYLSLYMKPEETRNLLGTMAKHSEMAKRFEKIRAADFEREYHQSAKAWDLAAPAPGFTPPVTTLTEARNIYHEAFAGLGAEYQSTFDALLDPANGRADIVPGGAPNRYGGGFSIGSATSESILFFGRYDGTFKDLSVIAHEGGHAVHRELMSRNHVLPACAQGPHFLFESFAAFNELILADYMAAHATQPEVKRYYREHWMDIKGLDAFYGAQDALIEQAIYDGVTAGAIRNADDLDKMTLDIDGRFSQFPASTPEMKTRWAMVSLMYEDPLYDVNYVYGGLLALKYYHLYTTRRDWFVPHYVALLKNGFDAPPAELLKRFLEIDPSGTTLLDDGVTLLGTRLEELETSRSLQR